MMPGEAGDAAHKEASPKEAPPEKVRTKEASPVRRKVGSPLKRKAEPPSPSTGPEGGAHSLTSGR